MTLSVLISGAGIAGSVLARQLATQGHTVTVVEKTPDPRRTGGHAVDIAGVSVEVVERMGVLPQLREVRVRRDRLVFRKKSGTALEMPRLSASISDRHMEIQRDELVTILNGAARAAGAEFVLDDEITALEQRDGGVSVEFGAGAGRDFDLVVGADGLHSGVRRLVFGDEARFRHDLGAHLAVFSHANTAGLDREVVAYADVDRAAFTYAVDEGRQARSLFLFRSEEADRVHHRDREGQVDAVRAVFDGVEEHVPVPLSEMGAAEDFYADSISQVRMPTWSQGRVTLVGDAGYSPGPAVGGGTALAILGSYVLARELELAEGDPATAFANTELVMAKAVEQSRKVGPSAIGQLVPGSRLAAWSTPHLMKALTGLPRRMTLALFSLQGSDRSRLDDFSSTPTG